MSPRTPRRRGGRRSRRRTGQTWAHLVLAILLLIGLVAFWGQLATGAAACFSNLAPTPAETPEDAPAVDDTPRRQIRIKRVEASP